MSGTVRFSVDVGPSRAARAVELSLVGAVAAADTIERAAGLATEIKWPSDVMLRRAAVAKVTVDARAVTVDINVDQTRDQLPAQAGSLYLATGRSFAHEPLLRELRADLERCLSAWHAGGLGVHYHRIGARDFLRGRRVRVNGTGGTAVMIDRHGRLQVDADDGERLVVEHGEVTYER